MDDGDDLGAAMRVDQLLGIEGATPIDIDSHHFGSASSGDLAHTLTEHPIDTDDNCVTGLDEIDERSFHPRGASAADRKRQQVFGAKNAPQPLVRLVEKRDEIGIEMTEHGTGE